MWEYSMTDDERVGFCRILDLKEDVSPDRHRPINTLPHRWQYIFKHVIRQVPNTSADEKAQIYRSMGLGDPPTEEFNLWVRSTAASFGVSDGHGTENYLSPNSHESPSRTSEFTEGISKNGGFQSQRHVQYHKYS